MFSFAKLKVYYTERSDFMQIGEKLKRMRLKCGLTQEELADRSELSKGFISQLERDLASPSIATLSDVLECLGSTLSEFFGEKGEEKVTFSNEDMFEKVEDTQSVLWLVPSAQKNELEPILLTLKPGASTYEDDPHHGEEFGYVLSGSGVLVLGNRREKIKKGSSFYFEPTMPHHIENHGRTELKLIWVSTPPSF